MEKRVVKIKVDWNDNYMACPENEDVAVVVASSSFKNLQKEIEYSIGQHVQGLVEDGITVPEEFLLEHAYEYVFTTRALLHYTERVVSRKALSEETGINLQQLSHYASGWRNPREPMRKKIIDGIHAIGNRLSAISVL